MKEDEVQWKIRELLAEMLLERAEGITRYRVEHLIQQLEAYFLGLLKERAEMEERLNQIRISLMDHVLQAHETLSLAEKAIIELVRMISKREGDKKFARIDELLCRIDESVCRLIESKDRIDGRLGQR